MEKPRLVLRAPAAAVVPDDVVTPVPPVVTTAIARKLCLQATYNKTSIRIAPHVLYTRHDDPILDAVVLERDGARPKLIKLGAFRLSGLTDLALTSFPFTRHPAFDADNPAYADTVILMATPG
ncbi:WYL domain-containing protein [Sphingomonas montana]|uniref:WYL domain-containing protein n=1 Tax=Sphingomonas montana TaxID=1843236 RepID=UPI001F0B3E27|nr:WYL domain-containing protein [Sphingomonas montana]